MNLISKTIKTIFIKKKSVPTQITNTSINRSAITSNEYDQNKVMELIEMEFGKVGKRLGFLGGRRYGIFNSRIEFIFSSN